MGIVLWFTATIAKAKHVSGAIVCPKNELQKNGTGGLKVTCKDCIHRELCADYVSSLAKVQNADVKYISQWIDEIEGKKNQTDNECEHFADRSRFVELPCKVGDTAWILVRYKNGDGYFYTGIVTGVHVTDRKTIYKLPYKRFNYIVIRFVQTDSLRHINFNEIGKTVFFTKEAAEQALKERESNA